MTAPKLRFKEFDGDWTRYKIAEATEYLVDGTHFSPKTTEGEFKYITSKNIRNDGLDLTNISYISKDEHEKIYKRCKVQLGDILLTKDGANTGNCCLNTLDEEFSLLSSVAVLRGKKDSFNNKFILQILQSDLGQNTIISSMSGQAITRITLAKLKDYSFYFPEFTEQNKIAFFLSAVDEKISQLTQKYDLLSQYKQGMMQKLFSQQIRFKADDGSEFGEWEEILVQYLVDKGILEKPMDGNHGEIHPTSKDYVEEGIPFVMATDIFNGKLHLEQTKKLTKQQADSLRKGFSREGDVLLTHKANIGNVAIVPQLDVEYLMLTPQVTYYRVINFSRLNNNFLKVYFESPQFQKNLLDLCTGATRLYIGISEQRKLPISLPCLEEQTKIANFLSAIDQKIEVVAQQIEQAKTWKKGLLQQMFV